MDSWRGGQQETEEESDGGGAGALPDRTWPASGTVNGGGDETVEVALEDIGEILADEPQERRVMEALLVTSKQVIADVGTQQVSGRGERRDGLIVGTFAFCGGYFFLFSLIYYPPL